MCKKYINDEIENQFSKIINIMNSINFPAIYGDDTDSKGHLSVREARKLALKARGHLNYALGLMGRIERVRYQRNDKYS